MIQVNSEVFVKNVSGKQLIDFMLNCSNTEYQEWWPGVHFAFHTIKHETGYVGNVVFFDEIVGKRHLRFKAIVKDVISNEKIVWQMKMGVLLPAYVTLTCMGVADGLKITHCLSIGYEGFGKLIDPLLRLCISGKFLDDLREHANIEFPLLAKKI